jgi:hypothetical protein
MLLAASAIVLALAGPQLADEDRKDLLILIDQSASMAAADGGSTRLEAAKKVAAEIIEALSANQRAAVACVAGDVAYRVHFTDNPRELLDAVEKVEQTDFALRPQALAALGGDDAWIREKRILLITDGCLAAADIPANVELVKVGKPLENAGLVAGDLQFLPTGPGRMSLYFQVASSYEKPVEADLILTHHGERDRVMKVIPLSIAPGMNKPEVYAVDGGEPGRWTAKLEVDDALKKDDTLFLAAAAPRPVRVAVKAEDRFFFEHSVLAFSNSGGLLTLTEQDPQVILAKGVDPFAAATNGTAAATLAIVFKPAGESPWWSGVGAELPAVAPRVLAEDHPGLRHVDVVSIPFAGARKLTAPPGALILVADGDGVPLVYRLSRAGRTAVVINMDPAAAEFYFSAWFPVLVHGMATHLAGREEPLAASYPPAAAAPIPGHRDGRVSRITTPAGETIEAAGPVYAPAALGFHHATNVGGDWTVACSLLSQAESQLGNTATTDTSRPLSRGWAPATWLTVLAIAILAGECLLYHRRKVG